MTENLDKRYQTIVILWFAMLMNIGVFFLIALLAAPATAEVSNRSVLSFGLAAMGTLAVVLSFVVKRKLLERSVVNQDVLLVQKAVVVACAMCEVAVLLGLVGRFILGNNDHYVLFGVGAIGMALHFPRREQLQAASYKSPLSGPLS